MKYKDKAKQKAEAKMTEFFETLGFDLKDPNLQGTPKRFVKMFCEELTAGNPEGVNVTTFPTKCTEDELVVVKRIPIRSTCAHHLMPIRGYTHIGCYFIPDENGTVHLPGLSKYARIVDAFSRKLQIQEVLTTEIAEFFVNKLGADLSIVHMEAEHMCMGHRGAMLHDSTTVTTQYKKSDRFKKSNKSFEEILNRFYRAIQT